jgi:hypothetical protein
MPEMPAINSVPKTNEKWYVLLVHPNKIYFSFLSLLASEREITIVSFRTRLPRFSSIV